MYVISRKNLRLGCLVFSLLLCIKILFVSSPSAAARIAKRILKEQTIASYARQTLFIAEVLFTSFGQSEAGFYSLCILLLL